MSNKEVFKDIKVDKILKIFDEKVAAGDIEFAELRSDLKLNNILSLLKLNISISFEQLVMLFFLNRLGPDNYRFFGSRLNYNIMKSRISQSLRNLGISWQIFFKLNLGQRPSLEINPQVQAEAD